MSKASAGGRRARGFGAGLWVVLAIGVFSAVVGIAFTALDRGRNVAQNGPVAAAPLASAVPWKNLFPTFAGNRRLPAQPRIHPQSQQMMDLLYNDANSLSGPGLVDAQSTYYDAKTSDPVHSIHCTELWGPAPTHTCVLEGKRIHIPVGAVPGANTDRHTSILDPDGCTVYDFWETGDMTLSTITASFAAEVNECTGNGFNQLGGAGATAGNGSQRLGRSPLAELETGVIHHAIEVVPSCNNNGPPAMVGQATQGSGASCKAAGPGIPLGAYLWSDIPPERLPAGLDNATRMLCVALNQFGGVVNDFNGHYNGLSINGLWNASDPAYAAWAHANMNNDMTNPTSCFPNGDWSHHIHVLAW